MLEIDSLIALMHTATVERLPNRRFLAEVPSDPFRLWCVAKSERAAVNGLRRIIRKLIARELR